MRYEILGPVRIAVDGRSVATGTHKMELLLRTLLIRRGKIVSLEQLTGELWGEGPPVRAVASLHVYVSQLRKIINRCRPGGTPLATRSPGYMLDIDDDEIDLDIFLRKTNTARAQMTMGDYANAADTLSGALQLWHEPLHASAFDGPIIREFAMWADELRVECVEMMALSLMESGKAQEAVRILYSLVSEHPLREQFYQLLMDALSKLGRRADALEVYQSARRLMRAELGLEPCRSLQETQQRILNDESHPLVPTQPTAAQQVYLSGRF